MFYPEDLVEEVRSRNDVVDVIGSYVRLQKKGNSYMGLCPFHSEKTPSFSVSRNKQMYHCFGCGVGGNVLTFVMEYENYSFVEALKMLAERVGVALPEAEFSPEEKKQASIKARLLEIHKVAAKYYFYQLKSERGRMAYDYLKNRAISDETMLKFGLGYSNKTSNDLYLYLKNLGYEDEILKLSGLVTLDEHRGANDKFWNRVMYPIMDINNKVIGFGGRVMGEGMPKYLNSPETRIFDKSRNLYGMNLARTSRKPNLIICEGYMDVIALHQAGFSNAVASLGTAFTGLQANLMKRYTKEVLICYDSDGAGTQAALRAIPILKEAGLATKVINMKPYKDPDEFIKTLGADEFQKRIDEAQNSFFFEIDVLERQFDFSDPEQKTRFFTETAKRLLVFQEELERNIYVEAIANKFHIGFDNLKRLVNQYGSQMTVSKYTELEPKTAREPKKNKSEEGLKQSQKILLTWLIDDVRLFEKIKGIILPSDFTLDLYKQAASMLFEQYEKDGTVIPAKIINYFESAEEQKEIASLFNTEIQVEMSALERQKAFEEIVLKIKKHSLDEQTNQAIEQNDIARLQEIIRKQHDLQKLHISLNDG